MPGRQGKGEMVWQCGNVGWGAGHRGCGKTAGRGGMGRQACVAGSLPSLPPPVTGLITEVYFHSR